VRERRAGFKPPEQHLHARGILGFRTSLCTAVVLSGVLLAACSSSKSTSAATHPSTTVALHADKLPSGGASVLVDAEGRSLYMFLPDHQKSVTCKAVCLRSWPLVYVPTGAKPQVGPGVHAQLVGTIKTDVLASGNEAVTYDGWPLYTYADDVSPGMTSGQGTDLNGGYWYLMQTNGAPLVPPGDPSA
jgi:predicted lipoprotein with Yx(FWY)xxD motif